MGFDQGLYNPPNTGGSFPPSPPSPVIRGNTIFVSKTGSPGGARQDVTYHFNTITQAVAVAQDGDIIIVYPGLYDDIIYLNNLPGTFNIHMMSGAVWSNPSYCLLCENTNVNITGDGVFITTGDTSSFAIGVLGGQVKVDCNSIACADGIAIGSYGGGDFYIRAKEIYTTSGGTPLKLNSTIAYVEADFVGSKVQDDSITTPSETWNNSVVYIENDESAEVYLYIKKVRSRAVGYTIWNKGVKNCHIHCDEIINEYSSNVVQGIENVIVRDTFEESDHVEIFGKITCYTEFTGYFVSYESSEEPKVEGTHKIYCDITTSEGPAAWVNGNARCYLYLHGILENTSSGYATLQVGTSGVAYRNWLLKVFVNGKVIKVGDYTSIELFRAEENQADQLELITDCVVLNSTDGQVSILSNDTVNPIPVKVYRLISNVPSDPNSILETIAQSVVDPNVV